MIFCMIFSALPYVKYYGLLAVLLLSQLKSNLQWIINYIDLEALQLEIVTELMTMKMIPILKSENDPHIFFWE